MREDFVVENPGEEPLQGKSGDYVMYEKQGTFESSGIIPHIFICDKELFNKFYRAA